mgnify:CR=1 FL=1
MPLPGQVEGPVDQFVGHAHGRLVATDPPVPVVALPVVTVDTWR